MGAIFAPGAGLATTAGVALGGNHVRVSGAPSRSHERAALATGSVPAAAPGGADAWAEGRGRSRRVAPATAIALTGVSKLTGSGAPWRTVTRGSLM